MLITRSIRLHLAAVLAFLAFGAQATTPPTYAEFDGHYYEVVVASKINWDAAKAAAASKTYQNLPQGIAGHLATIGSPEEDAFLRDLRQQWVNALHPSGSAELWVGAEQLPCATSQPEPGCGWMWINGESIAPTNGPSPYTNWQAGEPNNLIKPPSADQLASEDHLAIDKGGVFGWNDEGYLPNIWGYVVEYGDKAEVPATDCTAGGAGCNPTGGQILSYPPSAKVQPDATLEATTYLIHDNPARCGVQTLTLFNGAVVIPKYLCGHPDFMVIETHSTGVEILTGGIQVENLTAELLPGNLYGCTDVRQNPLGVVDTDPAHRDVVGWQSSNPAEMIETSLGSGRYQGTVAEVTSGCGSSRAIVKNGSYHFVGLRIFPGAGNDYAANTLGNFDSFVGLTKYKLKVLQASVVQSKPALPTLSYIALKALADAAIYFHDRGNYKAALLNVKLFLYAVDHTKYKAIANKNYNGDHLMRATNLQFIYTEKLIPYAP